MFLVLALCACGGAKQSPRSAADSSSSRISDSHVHFYQTGSLRLQEGKPREAAEMFREAIRRSPTHADSHYGLGVSLFQMGKAREAVAAFEETLRLNPAYADALISLGAAYDSMGETSKAVETFRRALDVPSPSVSGLANYHLGLIQLREGNYERAYFSFQKTLVTYPDFALAHAKAAETLEKQEKWEQALSHRMSALKAEPDSPEYTYAAGLTLFHLNRGKEARQYFEKTLALAPNSSYGDKALDYLKILPPT